jgi:hypothetical protein
LDGLEDQLCLVLLGSVVGGERQDFSNSKIHPALAGADVADPLQQFIEMIRLAVDGRVLEPLVIHREAFDEIFG